MRNLVVAILASLSTTTVTAQPQYATTRLLRLGEGNTGPTFSWIRDATFGSNHEIYALEATQLMVFDLSGALLRTMGRSGEGPGEFQIASKVVVTDDAVLVSSARPARLVRFTHEGSHQSTIDLPRMGSLRPDAFYPLRDGHVLASNASRISMAVPLYSEAFQTAESKRAEALREVRRANGRFVVLAAGLDDADTDTLFSFDHGRIAAVTQSSLGFVSKTYGPGGTWAVGGDSLIAFVNGFNGEIRILKLTKGILEIVRQGRVPVDVEPLSEEDWRTLGEGDRILQDPNRPKWLSGPYFKGRLDNAVLASDGALWVKKIDYHGSKEEPWSEFLVIPINGTAQRRVMLPAGFQLHAVAGTFLLGTRLGDFDVQVLEVWEDPGTVLEGRRLKNQAF